MSWIYTKDEKWCQEWSRFLSKNKKFIFLQSLHRVKSYQRYGMDWELMLETSGDKILQGSACIIVKIGFFKLFISTFGPLIADDSGIEINENTFYDAFVNRAKYLRAFAAQITVLQDKVGDCSFIVPIEGVLFDKIPRPSLYNLIRLKDESGNIISEESLISSFTSKGRRDVRLSCRKGLSYRQPTNLDDLREAYSCIEQNASNKGYKIRGWNDMEDLIVEGVQEKVLYFITAWYEDKIQGAVMLEKSANMLHYTMGGVNRHIPDLLTGYYLQLQAMNFARSLGLDYYDVSAGGPPQVRKFKSMFNPTLQTVFKTQYYVISKPKFYLFNKIYAGIKRIFPILLNIRNSLKK